jgi:hypothetical protein
MDLEAGFEKVQVAVGGGLSEPGVAAEIGLVQQVADAVYSQPHETPEVGERRHLGEVPEVSFEVGLDEAVEPERPLAARAGERCGRHPAPQQILAPARSGCIESSNQVESLDRRAG